MCVGLLHPAPATIPGLQGLGAALLGPRAHPLVPGHSPATSTRSAAEGQGCSWGSGQAPGACGAAPAGPVSQPVSVSVPADGDVPAAGIKAGSSCNSSPPLCREQQRVLHHPSGTGWGLAASPPSQQCARAPGTPRARRAPGPSPGPHPQPPFVCVRAIRARPLCSRALSSGLCLGSVPPRSAALHALPRAFA